MRPFSHLLSNITIGANKIAHGSRPMLDKERTLLNEATVVIFIVENEHVKGDSLQRQMPIHGRGRL